MRKAHSLHNEKLCDHLINTGGYDDWVVTTAFYSSLHLVQHQLFPMVIGTVKHVTFELYFANVIKKINPKKGKHPALAELVKSNLNACYPSYKWLLDSCYFARYNDYNTTPALAKKARMELETIKKHCTKV